MRVAKVQSTPRMKELAEEAAKLLAPSQEEWVRTQQVVEEARVPWQHAGLIRKKLTVRVVEPKPQQQGGVAPQKEIVSHLASPNSSNAWGEHWRQSKKRHPEKHESIQ